MGCSRPPAHNNRLTCTRANSKREALGRSDPRGIALRIQTALRSSDIELIRPALSPELQIQLMGQLDLLSARLQELGPATSADVTGARSDQSHSYFELRLTHALPPVPPGTILVSTRRYTYWLLGYVAEEQQIDTVLFRFGSGFRSGSQTAAHGSPISDPLVQAALTSLSGPASASFTHERAPQPSLGAATVQIPRDHKIGSIELPINKRGFWGYEEKLDPARHFVIKDVMLMAPELWEGTVSDHHSNSALIFIHGFNTTFEEALYRASQIVWDLQFKGTAVVFSWPSWGGVPVTDLVGLARTYA